MAFLIPFYYPLGNITGKIPSIFHNAFVAQKYSISIGCLLEVELIGPVKLDDWTSYLSTAFEGSRTAAAPMLPSGFTLPSLAIMEEVEL